MADLKQIILGICFAAVIAGMIRLIAPTGRYRQSIHFVLSVFMMLMLLQPFSDKVNLSEILDYEWQRFTPQAGFAAEPFEKAAAAEAKAVSEAIALQKGIQAEVIAVETSYRENKAWIDQISLIVSGGEQQALLMKQALEQQIDTEVLVSWTGDRDE